MPFNLFSAIQQVHVTATYIKVNYYSLINIFIVVEKGYK